ncbi:hypothetical protein KZZ07_24425 [Mameliella sp. CS4]|uniref:hypothetical protein n=1 Tax=Mameliella sp. CS4 TaxID=2862329 RepID=UPI001C5DEA59|nr:hypothetical protein [Mameliella sp. CS4]MBW4985692.1 hypothetical protein [Mameliella sp. CS4]
MTDTRPLALVISPQPWTGFQVSKHHYAQALAGRGWRVVFVDPPSPDIRPGEIRLAPTTVENLESLQYRPALPHALKFHARWLFDRMMRRQARAIRRRVGRPDLIWDFDNAYQFRDLRVFDARRSLFHLVDDVGDRGQGGKHADHVFTLHPVFCAHAGVPCRPDHVIDHGLGALHMEEARRPAGPRRAGAAPGLGFVGNLGAGWIDWEAMAEMVRRHSEARFTFWGPLPETWDRAEALNRVLAMPNVEFPGLTAPEDILATSDDIDVWLLPFRAEAFDSTRPLNSHKVLEYLATGKCVLMSWLEAYDGNPLVHVSAGPQADDLPDRLDALLNDLDAANAPERQAARKAHALERGYDRHLDHILSVVGLGAAAERPKGSEDAA